MINVQRDIRGEDNPPDEMYEATWRDAMKALEDVGAGGAFMLLVVPPPDGEESEVRFVTSPGRDAGVPIDWLVRVLANFVEALA